MMTFSISTHWNAGRSRSGEDMVKEILALGITSVELGYDTTMDLVPGVLAMVQQKAVMISSVHNYCPVPVGAPFGHPELFSLSSLDRRTRESAVAYTVKTINFAAEMGAKAMVVHAGNVEMKHMTLDLINMAEGGQLHSPAYDKIKMKLMIQRDNKVKKHLEQLYRSIEDIMPSLTATGVRMGIENLPSWESIPAETEMEKIFQHFGNAQIGYWHDMGHGQTRQNLGFIGHKHWFDKLSPNLIGMHIHDIIPPARDHLMPPAGRIDFAEFKSGIKPDTILVLEPAPGLPAAEITEGLKILREKWES